MSLSPVLNFKGWIEENRHLLKPPVGNKVVYQNTKDFIIMVVGGPNSRTDYHYNETEEFFYMLEGQMVLKIQEDGQPKDIVIKEGEIFLLPAKVLHSPRRPAGSIGLVIEKLRDNSNTAGMVWCCEKCNHKYCEKQIPLEHNETQLTETMEYFYTSEDLRTCDNCGTVMQVPSKK